MEELVWRCSVERLMIEFDKLVSVLEEAATILKESLLHKHRHRSSLHTFFPRVQPTFGLPLAICRRIVKSTEMRIEVGLHFQFIVIIARLIFDQRMRTRQ